MFGDQETIISSNPSASGMNNEPEENSRRKKLLIIGAIILLIIILGGVAFWYFTKMRSPKSLNNNNPIATTTVSTSTPATLPNLSGALTATTSEATSTFSNIAIEYLSFADFYKTPDNKAVMNFTDYKLPLNAKIDILNYYDLSRKLNLDPALTNLNTNGFATIDNPWPKEAPDFYSLYSHLEEQQIPSLITSDFILYYYQTVLKKAYKDIEENIFYDNLWSINKDLYDTAKNRYEARLASIGDVNDSVLEGERLEVAFFAVSLELLKPSPEQIAANGTLNDKNKFTSTDADNFYFVTPPYLKDDVTKEVKLIREGKQKIKSPVMLYARDYKDFIVPSDYRDNARLNNFYLTSKWLNSVFPLNYRDKNCPNCLIDKEDWRLSMIASSLISTDFSDVPELKNKWARIYKVMSYFNPLREDLSYVYYRDTLKAVFGANYKIDELFDDKNIQAKNNLNKLQAKLNAQEFSPFLGAIDKKDPATSFRLGFKMLVEPYSPNDYIFTQLTYPNIGAYTGTKIGASNITYCLNGRNRCNNFAFDVINLVHPIINNSYFDENTAYENYGKEAKALKDKLNSDSVWHTTNYWSTLSALSAYLNIDKTKLPLFNQTLAWQDHVLNTAVSAWVNMQLPLDKFSINQTSTGQNFDNFSRFTDNSYVEPNLDLVNELLANNVMMQKMFSALQVDQEVISVPNALEKANNDLTALQGIIIKELAGQTLSADDNDFISKFTKEFIITQTTDPIKQLSLTTTGTKNSLKEDLGHLKLMVLIHQDGADKVISVGPVWNNTESRY